MKKLVALFELKEEKWLYAAAFILFFPAMLINLGITPLLADEPTRALVALEMMFSENFITPTINGDYYYNKPPLYNWLLVFLFKLTGSTSEFVVRLPTVISIGIFAGLMYLSLIHI